MIIMYSQCEVAATTESAVQQETVLSQDETISLNNAFVLMRKTLRDDLKLDSDVSWNTQLVVDDNEKTNSK